MTFRRRLGVFATAVSGLLLAGLLLSAPAFAWHASLVRLEATCPPDSDNVQVEGTVQLQDVQGAGRIEVFTVDGGTETPVAQNTFTAGQTQVDFKFFVPSPDSDHVELKVVAQAFFEASDETPKTEIRTVELPNCKPEDTTTTTTTTTPPPPSEDTTTTTTPPPPPSNEETTTTVVPPNSAPPSTTPPTTAVLGKTATPAASGLPQTGANSVPVFIAALALVLVGGGLLLANRIRARHAK